MKDKPFVDIGRILDEMFETAEDFGKTFSCNFRRKWPDSKWDENFDFYPLYSYPPSNVYITAEKQLIFEFALAGFAEKNISLEFQGDYLVLSASVESEEPDKEVRYFKRRLKLKSFKDQKYYVPADKYDQEKVNAVFKNGLLTITVPPKKDYEGPEGVKINIHTDED